jgi:hypothetical protein
MGQLNSVNAKKNLSTFKFYCHILKNYIDDVKTFDEVTSREKEMEKIRETGRRERERERRKG